jgi:hypothetical protein
MPVFEFSLLAEAHRTLFEDAQSSRLSGKTAKKGSLKPEKVGA